MATKNNSTSPKDHLFEWEGKDRKGKAVRGELRAVSEQQVVASLRRQKQLAVFPKVNHNCIHRIVGSRKASISRSTKKWDADLFRRPGIAAIGGCNDARDEAFVVKGTPKLNEFVA